MINNNYLFEYRLSPRGKPEYMIYNNEEEVIFLRGFQDNHSWNFREVSRIYCNALQTISGHSSGQAQQLFCLAMLLGPGRHYISSIPTGAE